MSVLAVVFATGGTAWAALTVTGKHIRNDLKDSRRATAPSIPNAGVSIHSNTGSTIPVAVWLGLAPLAAVMALYAGLNSSLNAIMLLLMSLSAIVVFLVLATESTHSSQQSRNYMEKVPVYSRAMASACGWDLNLVGSVFISSFPILLSARLRRIRV